MIKSIRLQNFQAHRDSKILFSPGVNAIIGKTGAGKTSILRALRWVIFNKPAGDALQSHWAEDARVDIELDDGNTISRVRTKTKNLYILNGKEFSAFGQGVPQEIRDVLNMEDLNFRSQMDAPFLLSQSPGEVAQVLNRIVNLDVIDTAQSNIRKKKAGVEAELKVKKRDVDDLEIQLTEFNYLEEMEAEVAKLESMEKIRVAMAKSMTAIQSLLTESGRLTAKNEQVSRILRVEKDFQKITNLVEKKKQATDKHEKIKGVLDSIMAQTQKLRRADDLLSAEAPFNAVCVLIEKKNKAQTAHDAIGKLLLSIQNSKEKFDFVTAALVRFEEQFHKRMPRQCPLCGQEVE